MRSLLLDPLYRSIRTLDGVGPKNAQFLEKLIDGERIIDLLRHKPIEVINRQSQVSLSQAKTGNIITVIVTIISHTPSKKRGKPYRIRARDAAASPIDIVYFNASGQWLKDTYPIGKDIMISGKIEKWNDQWQMLHPDYTVPPERRDEIKSCEPIYPMTQGLSPKILHKTIEQALTILPELPEWIDAGFLSKNKWPRWFEAMTALHSPQSSHDTLPGSPVDASGL